jgi:hypothetical protein
MDRSDESDVIVLVIGVVFAVTPVLALRALVLLLQKLVLLAAEQLSVLSASSSPVVPE